jgi:hypothetical protein
MMVLKRKLATVWPGVSSADTDAAVWLCHATWMERRDRNYAACRNLL